MQNSTAAVRPPPRDDIVAALRENPDGVLERLAEGYGVSTFEVVRALPGEHCQVVSGDRFEYAMGHLTTWGKVLMIVHTPNIVLECKGPIPPGSASRGYFNMHGESPIGGHIKADRCTDIAFVSRPFMGRPSCSIQFFDMDGAAMFKIFVARDDNRNMITLQLEKFEQLKEELCSKS
ncbi:MAG: heme utilization cystosolic carrier protein HutX [Hyphomicrobiaceae bacterium]|nr:heme utilization cystosolic carrier protein HutX [Hyphomicrobiaceae bacterium]